ncbi:MAG TPA: hypothetical protein DIC36_06730 [Gammaproteobacteria bacterium]|nr:hypothetical protein [Gammaproteobacteria bacterium]
MRGFVKTFTIQQLAERPLAGIESKAVDDVDGHGAPRVADGERMLAARALRRGRNLRRISW